MTCKLSPSDFGFLYDDCKRCWWIKTRGGGVVKESLPAVFSQVDKAMKDGITIEHLQALGVKAKAFIDAGWVESKPHELNGTSVFVRGCIDRLLEMEDGSVLLLDYKMTHPSAAAVAKYARQLHAYEWAMRDPAKSAPIECHSLGLLCFNGYGAKFKVQDHHAAIQGTLVYLPVPMERPWFEGFLDELCGMIAAEESPKSSPDCTMCQRFTDMMNFREQNPEAMTIKSGVKA